MVQSRPRLIVKIQWPLSGKPLVLIYDKDRTIEQLFPATEELRTLFPKKLNSTNAKVYHFAHIDANNMLVLNEQAPPQPW